MSRHVKEWRHKTLSSISDYFDQLTSIVWQGHIAKQCLLRKLDIKQGNFILVTSQRDTRFDMLACHCCSLLTPRFKVSSFILLWCHFYVSPVQCAIKWDELSNKEQETWNGFTFRALSHRPGSEGALVVLVNSCLDLIPVKTFWLDYNRSFPSRPIQL